ncbi:hypothetical protein [Vagococcus intermedius]|uniref:Tetratricopeptide repeat protein n=1 Tax=Vagococcus intermedius TaxID=2991418 RepID=A0AAF0CVK3_9ENTE|nr:hypothetical protein [Vagococcus intermedius]WEG73825.1 hypothetical protein OL234_02620 [Vagococcus intermedius]WEG75910.1 hypothetical protein OL235_02630 [Vagococcus intermedius]
MGERIEFSNNFEGYLALGKQAFNDGQYKVATENLEAAYNLKPDFEANYGLVKSLLAQNKSLEAEKIATEMQTEYLADSDFLKVYLQALLSNQKFIHCHKLVHLSPITPQEKNDLIRFVGFSEENARQFLQASLADRVKAGLNLGECSFMKALEVISELEKVPFKEYADVATTVIHEKQVSLLLSQLLIESLVAIDYKERVIVPDIFGGTQKLKLAELEPIGTTAIYQQCMTELMRELGATDSEMAGQLQQALHVQMVLIYPKGQELISDASLWVKLFVASYLGQEIKVADTQKEMMTSMRKVQQLIQNELLQNMG